MRFNVDVGYNDRVYETLDVEAMDEDDAEFTALNIVRDHNDGSHNVEVLQVRLINAN